MHEGACSKDIDFHMGLAQGDTLSPTLFAIFVDSMLHEVWQQHDGVPLPDVPIAKLVAQMFADDFAALAPTEDELQALVTFLYNHLCKWRLKANIDKSGVMVVEPLPVTRSSPAVAPRIMLGAAPLPVVDQYKYLGAVLHKSLKWDAHMEYVATKTNAISRALAPLLHSRGMSAEAKRVVLLSVVRPVMEHAAHVWNPHTKSGKAKLDSLQMALVKACFHCAPQTSHVLVQQELGVRPMHAWTDKRQLELWHVLQHMAADRLPAQVARVRWAKGPGVKKAVPLWAARSDALLQTLSIDPAQANDLKYAAFKSLVHGQTKELHKGALEQAAAGSSVVRAYVEGVGGTDVQYAGPAGYLKGAACGKGRELMMRLRTQSLTLKGHTGKFARRAKGDEIDDQYHCVVCEQQAVESGQHFVLECEHYAQERAHMFAQLRACAQPAAMAAFEAMPIDKQLWALLDDKLWIRALDKEAVMEGRNVVVGVVAAFLAKAWKKRNDTMYNEHVPAAALHGHTTEHTCLHQAAVASNQSAYFTGREADGSSPVAS